VDVASFWIVWQVLRPKEKRVYLTVNDIRIDLEMRVRAGSTYFRSVWGLNALLGRIRPKCASRHTDTLCFRSLARKAKRFSCVPREESWEMSQLGC
jgi:hypothetical protein